MSTKNNAAENQPQPDDIDQIPNGQETLTEEMADPATGSQSSENEGLVTDEATELRQQLGELKDKYMRLYAEFDNFKKRSVREKLDWMKTASQDTMTALLPVLDDFDRAKKFANSQAGAGLSEGIELVYQKLFNTLKNKGLEAMESTGQPFDPEIHDAITEIPAPTEDLKGKVIDTVENGYRLNDKIIRHAKVVVGK